MSNEKIPDCPECGTQMKALMFLGLEPDGFICPDCDVHYHRNEEGELKADSVVIA